MIHEVFNPKTGFLESNWEGEVTLGQIIDYIRRTKENTSYPRKLKILTSTEKARLMLGVEELEEISKENKLSVKNYEVIIDAFVVDEALVAALSTMYQKVSAVKNYIFRIFSTREAAEEWLAKV